MDIFTSIAPHWAGYFGLAIVQNTLFLVVIFAVLSLIKNTSAQSKYLLCLSGLIKLCLPPFLPLPSFFWPFAGPTPSAGAVFGALLPVSAAVQSEAHLSWLTVIMLIWMATLIGLLLTSCVATLSLKHKLAGAVPLQLHMSGFHIYSSSRICSPMTLGIFPKKIFLPPYWQKLPADCRDVMLQHEIAHIRRKDGLVYMVQLLVQAVYFFHPLVWLLNERINEYREMACDDQAIHTVKLAPNKFSRYLVHLAEHMLQPQWSYVSATALIRQKHKLLKRVNYQMTEERPMKLPRKKTMLIFSGLILLMIMLSMYYSQSGADEPKQQTAAGVTGKVWGSVASAQNNETLAGAKVMLDGTALSAVSDKEGNFFIPNVPPGVYTATALYPGYKSTQLADVKVKVDESTKLDFKLEASGEMEIVPPPPPAPDGKNISADKVPPPPLPEKLHDMEVLIDYDKPPEPVAGGAALLANIVYPPQARDAKQEGTVYVKALIGIDGTVKALVIEKPSENTSLNQAAVDAVKKTQWKPALKDNEKVECWIVIPIKFKLN